MIRSAFWLTLAVLSTVTLGFAAEQSRVDPLNKSQEGLAVKGYDVVSYFDEGKPVKGSEQFEYKWSGATWRFSTAAHRDAFAKDPERYAPQYGSYCSFAVSRGKVAPINPADWKIVNGKLYLNNGWLAQKMWLRDVPGNIEKADRNWPNIHQ